MVGAKCIYFTDHKGYRNLKWRNKTILRNRYRSPDGRRSLRQMLKDKENLDKQKKKKFQSKRSQPRNSAHYPGGSQQIWLNQGERQGEGEERKWGEEIKKRSQEKQECYGPFTRMGSRG